MFLNRILKSARVLLLLMCAGSLLALFFMGTTYTPPDVDHAAVIRSLNTETLKRGKEIYQSACVACHGKDGTASLPQARSFNKDEMRFGNRPYDMWKTITFGAGMMAAQTWLNPAERYYVVQYIREEFMKKSNPRQYFKITDEYLAKLPKSQKTIEQQRLDTRREALKGSLRHGQEWFMHNKSNYGFAIHSQLQDHGTAVLTVVLDSNVNLAYNLLRMGTVAAWSGNLNVSDTKYKRYRGEGEPFIEGKKLEGLGMWQWTYGNKFDDLNKSTNVRAPLPKDHLDYHGHYTNGKKIILSYSVEGRKVLEFPRVMTNKGKVILSQTLQLDKGPELSIYIGQLENDKAVFSNKIMSAAGSETKDENISPGNILVSKATSEGKKAQTIVASVISDTKDLKWRFDEKNRMILTIPASSSPITLNVLRTNASSGKDISSFGEYVKNETAKAAIPVIADLIKGGPAYWTKQVTVKGDLDVSKPHFDPRYFEDEDKTNAKKLVKLPADYPYTVDNIGLPFNNAYNSWIRTTSVGFMQDGRIIITTYMGDVWMGSGIDSTLKKINWQRIATGLYEPMGLKVINDEIYVTNRNGITILRDLNGDNETDFYENFFSDNDVSAFFHAFNFGLETDSKGNLYYVKPGQYTNNRDPGNVIKVSPDGKKWESIATGFRVNNGVTVTPGDKIFVSDNQGNWTPANKINFIEKGKYYGYVQNVIEGGWSPNGIKIDSTMIVNDVISPEIIPVPDTFQQPALWMPQEFDNSPGGGVWSEKGWGPLGDQFIHTSYGTGWVYHFMPRETDGVTQAAMVALPFQFEAGIQRAAVNPADKQIYVTGLTGWDDGVSEKYGVLSRIRYTGGEGHLLKDAQVVKGGLKLTFNFKLDDKVSTDLANFELAQWNYKRTHRYGSAHYSVKNPNKEGMDKVIVNKVTVLDNGHSLFLELPEMVPVQTLRVRFGVKGADGATVKDVVYMTINKIPG